MTLYDYFRSSAAFRVRIALNLKGLAYRSLPVNLLKGEQKEPGYRAVNPHARVPALDVGEAVLIQSPAILEYLDETHPEPPFLSPDPILRARIRAVGAIVACDIHPLNNSGTLAYLKGPLGLDQDKVDGWYRHWVEQGFDAIESLIEPGPYAFGPRPTLADIYLVPQVFNARRFNVPLEPYPKIRGVEEACMALEAFAAAAPQRQPDAA